jgi:DNA-binding SARP family transcriptional activator
MEFRVLGPLEMRGAAGIANLGGPRQRSVLATLLLHANSVVSISRLVDSVWDDPPGTSSS